MIATETDPVRSGLLKLANDLPYFAKSSKPVGAILAEARARLQQIEQIEQTLEPSEPFNRITAEELASGNFDLTYLIDGVLVKDQPAGLVAPKKSLKTNISIDLAISLATGGKFLGYFRVAEPKRMAVFSGESGMATIQETALRISDAAGVPLNETGIIFSDTVPSFGDSLNMEAFRRFLEADGIEVVIVDPVYLCLPCDVNPANLFDIGRRRHALRRTASPYSHQRGRVDVQKDRSGKVLAEQIGTHHNVTRGHLLANKTNRRGAVTPTAVLTSSPLC